MTTYGLATGLRLAVCTNVKSAGVVQVKIGKKTVSANCPQDLSVSVQDPVMLALVGAKYWIVQRYYSAVGSVDASSDGSSDEPVSAPCTQDGSTTFIPTKTATYRNGKWRTDTDDVLQGEYGHQGNMVGCAFYGKQITNSLAGVTVLSASIKAHRYTGGSHSATHTTLVHIAQFTKPSGAPTHGGSYTGPYLEVGKTGTKIIIDTSLAQSLVDGTYGGLGIYDSSGSPYVRLGGRHRYAGSFALTVNWRRSY